MRLALLAAVAGAVFVLLVRFWPSVSRRTSRLPLPAPRGKLVLPVLGHMLPAVLDPMVSFSQLLEDLWASSASSVANRSGVWKMHFLGQWVVVFSGEASRQYLRSLGSVVNFYMPPFSKQMMSGEQSLLFAIFREYAAGHTHAAAADYQTWRRTRTKGMVPARVVAATVPFIRKILRSHIAKWLKQGRVSSDSIGRMVFDLSITWSLGERTASRKQATIDALYPKVHALSQAMFGAPISFIPGTLAWKGVRALPEAQRLAAELVDAAFEEESAGKTDRLIDNQVHTIQTVAASSEQSYSAADQTLSTAMLGDIFAAYHTTSGAVSGEIFHLATLPQICQQTRDAVMMLGDIADADLLHAIQGTIIDGVVRESLRLAPPGVFGFRELLAGVTLPAELTGTTPVHLEKGTRLIIHHTSEHFSENSFKKATVFDPTRWMRNDSDSSQPPKLGTFGHYAHSCLGRAFATAVSQIFVFELLRATKSIHLKAPGATRLQQFPWIALDGESLKLE